ncbi:MAG: MBL fold metallo-hydrolase [Balneolaceae bacterium]|nr:MBL fold metallo-hydrolase [Balneolaceae bacterium]
MSNSTVVPLYEGTFSVAIDKKFNRIDRNEPPAKGALKLSINPFLIKSDDQNILFDAGIGDLFGGDTTIETILENLADNGVSDYEISDIFISHLHFDHMGGLANRENGYWELTFPDATIWVSEGGWKKQHTLIDKESESNRDFFHFIDSMANIQFLSDEDTPINNVSTKTIGGHTEFHQAIYFDNGNLRCLMAGDVIGRRISINRNFAAKYDFMPKQSMQARDDLKKFAHDNDYIILAYHETDFPMFKLTDFDNKSGYTVKNI